LSEQNKINVPDSCPHCGHKLTPWQQVLLKVDKALVCKNCWYRIILEDIEEPKPSDKKDSKDSSDKGN
jgi:DNA-directed RNA polymerase subunit RPC12/RpoP